MKEGLYAITPNNLKQDELLEKIEVILNFGVKLIQYRDKELVKNEYRKTYFDTYKIAIPFDQLEYNFSKNLVRQER